MATLLSHELVHVGQYVNEVTIKTALGCFESEAIKSSSVCKECKNAGEDSDKLDIVDEVGGCHGGGVGWNPQGIFCGECSSSTCKGCVNEYIKD